MTTVSAVLDPADMVVRITVAALPIDTGGPWPATPWTLYRTDGVNESVVRGAVERPLTASSTAVVVDREYKLSGQFLYQVRYFDTVSGAVVASSAWVVPPARDLPRVTDPVSGNGVDLTVVEWPEVTRESRGSSFDVDGREYPLVHSAPMGGARSQVTLRTLDAGTWRAFERMLRRGTTILLRASKPELDDTYLRIESYTKSRLTRRAEDTRRLWTLDVVETGMPAPQIASVGSTLADLHAAYPGTLADIAAAFDYLYEIAQAPL